MIHELYTYVFMLVSIIIKLPWFLTFWGYINGTRSGSPALDRWSVSPGEEFGGPQPKLTETSGQLIQIAAYCGRSSKTPMKSYLIDVIVWMISTGCWNVPEDACLDVQPHLEL